MSGILILGSLVDATNCIDGLAYLLVSLLLCHAVPCCAMLCCAVPLPCPTDSHHQTAAREALDRVLPPSPMIECHGT